MKYHDRTTLILSFETTVETQRLGPLSCPLTTRHTFHLFVSRSFSAVSDHLVVQPLPSLLCVTGSTTTGHRVYFSEEQVCWSNGISLRENEPSSCKKINKIFFHVFKSKLKIIETRNGERESHGNIFHYTVFILLFYYIPHLRPVDYQVFSFIK